MIFNFLENWVNRYSVLYLLTFFCEGFVLTSLGPSIPIKAKISGQHQTDYSTIFIFLGIGFITGCLVVNQLEKKIGTHKTMALSLTIISIMCFFNAFETRVFWNAVQMFAIGFNHNIIGVLGQVQIMNIQTTSLNSWLQTLHFGFGVGSSLCPIIISVIGLKAIFCYGIMVLVLAILIVRQKQSKQMMQQNVQKQEEKLQIIEQSESNRSIVFKLSKLIGILLFVYVGTQGNIAGWISTYTAVEGVTSQQNAGLSTSLFWLFITFGRFLAIPISVKFPAYTHLKFLMNFGIIASFFCLILLMFDLKVLAVFLGSSLLGFYCSAIYPLGISIPASFGYKLNASNTALITLLGAGGIAVVPFFVGYLIKFLGSYILFVSTFGFSITMYLIFKQIMKFKPSQIQQKQLKTLNTKLLETHSSN